MFSKFPFFLIIFLLFKNSLIGFLKNEPLLKLYFVSDLCIPITWLFLKDYAITEY